MWGNFGWRKTEDEEKRRYKNKLNNINNKVKNNWIIILEWWGELRGLMETKWTS